MERKSLSRHAIRGRFSIRLTTLAMRATRTRLSALRVAFGEVPSASLRCMESKNGQLAF